MALSNEIDLTVEQLPQNPITLTPVDETDYNNLVGKPKVNSIILEGNKTSAQLGLASAAQGAKADSAVQPADLSVYRTAAEQDVIDNTKQDTISDLETIRSGAALGATSIQPSDVTSTYSPTGTAPLNGVAVDSALSSIGGNPLFHYTFADHLFSNTNWLRADTFSWQDGSVYTSAYQHLVNDIAGKTAETETIGSIMITFYRATDGHKICLANQAGYVSDLYDATGVAWYYILDTANTRFKLPRTKYNVVGLRDTVGSYISESLPNITGNFSLGGTESPTQSDGAIYMSGTRGDFGSGHIAAATNPIVYLNASRSSSAYQDNAPVQQRATQMYLYFYCGNTVINQTTIDVGQITETLNGKADTDLSNVNNTGKSTAAGWAMPSDTYIDLTLGANNSTYTAPANGWFVLEKSAGTKDTYAFFTNLTNGMTTGDVCNSDWQTMQMYIPAQKEDVIRLTYNITGNTNLFRFIYAEGSKSEAN